MAEKNNKTLEKARFEMNCLTGDAVVQRLAELRGKWDIGGNSGIYWAKEEGKEEGRDGNKKEIARKLIKMKLSIEQIMEATGLTKEQIERLE